MDKINNNLKEKVAGGETNDNLIEAFTTLPLYMINEEVEVYYGINKSQIKKGIVLEVKKVNQHGLTLGEHYHYYLQYEYGECEWVCTTEIVRKTTSLDGPAIKGQR